VVLTAGRSWLLRAGSLAVILYGLYLASDAGSRGGLVAFAAICCFVLLRASWRQRIGFAVAMAILLSVTIAVLPQHVLTRYATIFEDTSATDQEAIASKETRTYLLESSLRFTFEHPVFGVGPGEFSDYEGTTAREHGQHGAWQVAHNSYTQVSSETGIPGFLFLIAAMVSTYWTLDKVYRRARHRAEYRSIAMAAFCIQISLVGFSTTIFFLSLIYNLYLPALGGFAIAVASAAQAEFTAGNQLGTRSPILGQAVV
ncbi:MAG: O-antigen ligase family protein, partial [Candidatus Binataceae bacterium]